MRRHTTMWHLCDTLHAGLLELAPSVAHNASRHGTLRPSNHVKSHASRRMLQYRASASCQELANRHRAFADSSSVPTADFFTRCRSSSPTPDPARANADLVAGQQGEPGEGVPSPMPASTPPSTGSIHAAMQDGWIWPEPPDPEREVPDTAPTDANSPPTNIRRQSLGRAIEGGGRGLRMSAFFSATAVAATARWRQQWQPRSIQRWGPSTAEARHPEPPHGEETRGAASLLERCLSHCCYLLV